MATHMVGGSVGVVEGAAWGIKAGDRVVIRGGERGRLALRGLRGRAEAPIVVLNEGLVEIADPGSVGMYVDGCEHVHIRGDGDVDVQYGIRIEGWTNAGVNVRRGSTGIELWCLEVGPGQGAGMRLGSLAEDAGAGFVQEGMRVLDCWVHDCSQEGFYCGHGTDQQRPGCTMRGLEIARCVVERCGWDGIQVRECPDARVHGNRVREVGTAVGETAQGGAGLIIGHGTGGRFWGNRVLGGDRGVMLLGHLEGVEVDHNVLVDLGRERGMPGVQQMTKAGMNLHHNTIAECAGLGIRTPRGGRAGRIEGNLLAGTGGIQSEVEERGYNVALASVWEAGFVDAGAGDYRLREDSPARGAGRDGEDVGAFGDQEPEPEPEPGPEPEPEPGPGPGREWPEEIVATQRWDTGERLVIYEGVLRRIDR